MNEITVVHHTHTSYSHAYRPMVSYALNPGWYGNDLGGALQVGEGFVSLDTVLADDVDRTEVELHDHDGHAVGTVGLVSRLPVTTRGPRAAVFPARHARSEQTDPFQRRQPRRGAVQLCAAVNHALHARKWQATLKFMEPTREHIASCAGSRRHL